MVLYICLFIGHCLLPYVSVYNVFSQFNVDADYLVILNNFYNVKFTELYIAKMKDIVFFLVRTTNKFFMILCKIYRISY